MIEALNLRPAVRALQARAQVPRLRGTAAVTGYDGAITTRRTRSWGTSVGDINSLVFGSLETLRSKARDQVRRNAWAANGLDSFVANCVGTGIKPQSQHPDAATRKAIQKLWLRWTDEADSDGMCDFYGMQGLVCREIMESGECLVRLRPRFPQDGLSVPLQLQGLEPEHLPLWKTELAANGNVVRAGIETTVIGKRVAYHLYRNHPGDVMNPKFSGEIVRVPAEYVLHQYHPLRFGQMRGQPWLVQVLIKLWELDQYDDAELVRKKVAAMFAGFITKERPEGSFLPGEEEQAGDEETAVAGLEPGTLQVLLPGESVTFSTPADVGAAYETFMRVQLRAIAAGMGITYEQLTGDLTGVNYSSIRAGLLEFRRRCEQFQHQVLVFQFCRPVWRAWMQAAILSGALDLDPADPDTYAVKWVPPGFDWVDPLKDIKAEVLSIRGGLKSRSESISERGYDAEEVDMEIAADQARADELGLKFDTDGRQPASAADAATGASATDGTGSGGEVPVSATAFAHCRKHPVIDVDCVACVHAELARIRKATLLEENE